MIHGKPKEAMNYNVKNRSICRNVVAHQS